MDKKFIIILISVLLDAVGFSFLFPIIPFIIHEFGGNVFVTGVTVSAAAVGMAIGGLIFGRLSDMYGRKNILLITIALNAIGYGLFPFINSLGFFIFARFLNGLGGGGIAVAQAYIGDITPQEKHTVVMGYIGATLGIGFAIGPLLGSILTNMGLGNIGIISCFLLLVSFFNIAFFLPRITPCYYKENIHMRDIFHTQKILMLLFISLFIVSMTIAGLQTILGIFLVTVFHITQKEVVMTFGMMGLIAIAYVIFTLPFVTRRIRDISILSMGGIFLALGISMTGFAPNIIFALIGIIIATIGLININTTTYSLIARFSTIDVYGKNMGIATTFTSFGDITGPLLISILYTFSMYLPFIILVILLYVMSFSIFLLLRNYPHNSHGITEESVR